MIGQKNYSCKESYEYKETDNIISEQSSLKSIPKIEKIHDFKQKFKF